MDVAHVDNWDNKVRSARCSCYELVGAVRLGHNVHKSPSVARLCWVNAKELFDKVLNIFGQNRGCSLRVVKLVAVSAGLKLKVVLAFNDEVL